MYRLGFPNREVEEGFIKFLLPYYANVDKIESPFQISKFVHEVEQGDYDAFFRRLQSFFADTPYELVRDLELHYQNVLFIVFKLIGFYVKAEYHTSEGRIDLILQTDQFVYIMSSNWTALQKKQSNKLMISIMRKHSMLINVNSIR